MNSRWYIYVTIYDLTEYSWQESDAVSDHGTLDDVQLWEGDENEQRHSDNVTRLEK